MSTPTSTTTTYITPAQFLARADVRLVGDLCSDTGTRVTPSALPSDPNLAAAIMDACGDLEAACLAGHKYEVADLTLIATGATSASQARMFRLLSRLTLCYLYERRPEKGPVPQTYTIAWEHLDALADGKQIFGLVEHQDAGVITTEVETAQQVEARNLTSWSARRYYGRRANDWDPNVE